MPLISTNTSLSGSRPPILVPFLRSWDSDCTSQRRPNSPSSHSDRNPGVSSAYDPSLDRNENPSFCNSNFWNGFGSAQSPPFSCLVVVSVTHSLIFTLFCIGTSGSHVSSVPNNEGSPSSAAKEKLEKPFVAFKVTNWLPKSSTVPTEQQLVPTEQELCCRIEIW